MKIKIPYPMSVELLKESILKFTEVIGSGPSVILIHPIAFKRVVFHVTFKNDLLRDISFEGIKVVQSRDVPTDIFYIC